MLRHYELEDYAIPKVMRYVRLNEFWPKYNYSGNALKKILEELV